MKNIPFPKIDLSKGILGLITAVEKSLQEEG
jgi:hypothetical protein